MIENKNSEFLKQKALKKIKLAEDELMKPNEDVVSHSVCSNSRLAIQQLLESYLLNNNIKIQKKESLALLLERCIILNSKFKTINLSNLECRHNANNQNYCSDVGKVSSCLTVAKQIELLLNN